MVDAFVRYWIGDITEKRVREIIGDEEFERFKQDATTKAWKQYSGTAALILLASAGVGYVIGTSRQRPKHRKRR
jgi:hypothetical protein